MTDLVVRPTNSVDIHPGQEQAIARLAEWAQAAEATAVMVAGIVDTSFVPQQYRGKPAEATAAVLAGAEVGLSPMASLRAFDNIQGTPAPKAMTLRAIVQAQGHEIRIDESTPVLACVSGRRKDQTEWQTSTWTIERAQQAGYPNKNPNWKSNPTAMLVARATAEVCRWIASDAIMGMPYTAEEIRDEGDTFEPRPRPMRVTAAEILGTTDLEPEPQPAHPRELDTEPVDGPEMVDQKQKNHIFALLGERGITDRAARLAGISKVVGRQVTSTNDLTADEADQVIQSLQNTRTEAAA